MELVTHIYPAINHRMQEENKLIYTYLYSYFSLNFISCGSSRVFAHGKVRLYPWEVCILCVTSIPTVKLPMRNHYRYIKKNKRISHDVS